MQTPEDFTSLAAVLLGPRSGAPEETYLEIAAEPEAQQFVPGDEVELARDVRLFRARVAEAVEESVERLCAGIAAEVLARELQLAPADIEAIVDRALGKFSAEEPLRVLVHPDDAANLRCGVPVAAQAGLRRGDAIVELRCGSVDAALAVRLETLLAATAA